MKLFISWSGSSSHIIATALKSTLSMVIQAIDPFLSSHDIDAGSRWFSEIGLQLESTNYGILCLTPQNITAPWILFEAGALSKALGHSRVTPLLIDLKTSDLTGPLAQFNAVNANKDGMLKLFKSINKQLEERALDDAKLSTIFDRFWPDFDKGIALATEELKKGSEQPAPSRNNQEVMEELITLTRAIHSKVSLPNLGIEPTFGGAMGRGAIRSTSGAMSRAKSLLGTYSDVVDDKD